MADSTLNILIKLRDLTRAGIAKLKKNFSDAADSAEDLEEVDVSGVEKDVKGLNRELRNTSDQAADAAFEFNELRGAGLAIAAIGAAIATPFLAAAKAAGEFQTQIAEIQTLVEPTATANEELRDSVVELSNEFGVDRSRVAAALYQTISTGAAAGAEANKQLSVALTLARGGVADVEEATLGLATVLNAFSLGSERAEDVADSLFTTVKGGATTISQLSQFLFQAAPLASALSVEFEELNAAIQTITLSGTPTAQATTQIRAALQGLARDTPEVNEALGEFGSVSEAISKIGLQATFDKIRKASKGSEAELIKLVGSIEGVQAVLQLTGEASANFTKALKAQDEASGAAARAADIVEQSFGVQLETAITRVSNAFVQLGETVIPLLQPMVVGVGELAVSIQELLASSEKAQTIVQLTLSVVALGIAFGGTLTAALVLRKGFSLLFLVTKNFARGLKLFVIQVGRATGALRLLKVAIGGLAGPIGLVITVLTSLAFSAVAFADDMSDVTNAVDEAIEAFNTLSTIDRIRALELARTQVTRLKADVAEAAAELKKLEAQQKGTRGLGAAILTTESDIRDQKNALAGLRDELARVEKQLKDIEGKSKISLTNVDVSEEGVAKLSNELIAASLEADKLTKELLALSFATDIDKFKAEGVDPAGAEEATHAAQGQTLQTAREIAAEDKLRITLITQRLALLDKVQARAEAELEFAKGINEEARRQAALEKKDDEEKITRAQALQAAKTSVSLTGAENRLAEASARAQANLIREQNVQLTSDLEDQLAIREINEQEFADAREKIILSQLKVDQDLAALQLENARKLTDAKLAVIEAGIDREKLVEDEKSGSETASVSRAALALADARREQLELEFQVLETTVTGQLAVLGERTKAQVKEIADDLAEGTIEGIEKAYSRLIQEQGLKIDIVNAELKAGVISLATAQDELAAISQETADILKEDLIPAVLLLLEIAPEDPALLALLDKFLSKVKETEKELTVFAEGVKNLLESNLADFFEDLLNNVGDLGDAFEKFIQGVRKAVLKLIAERLAKRLIDSLFSFLGSAGGGEVASPSIGGFIKAKSGGVLRLAKGSGPGGSVRGPGTATSDSIPAMLSDGEYVMKAASVKKYGVQMMEAINRGIAEPVDVAKRLSITKPPRRRFQEGGQVGTPPSQTQLRAGASASGQGRSEQPTELVINISDDALNSMMRDVLEREFGRILATR